MNSINEIRVNVNDKKHGYFVKGIDVLSHILSLAIWQINYMSKEAIVDWLTNSLDIVEEMMILNEDKTLNKKISLYRKSIDYIKDRESAISAFTNIMLACDGLNTLHGFGMANVQSDGGRNKLSGGKILINPEKRTIYNKEGN